ncbi:hypothetical protein ACHAPJ_005759 [Fusarium lateritium]
MCTETVAQCPVCLDTATLQWKYCMPYLKTSLEVRREDEGLIPPNSWFTSHKPVITRKVTQGLTPEACPNDDYPSKIPPEEENGKK